MKYASIIPLVGGENIGIQNALGGQLPEYVLSYKVFESNDSHYMNYLKEKGWKGEYYIIDGDNSDLIPDLDESVDVINSVCPCAGLSGLSGSSHADSATNDWMYNSSRYVLENVKPKVLWGENAPALATSKGRKVADNLYKIGQEYGYTLLLIKTSSSLHGNPQGRARTFYFFFKDTGIPLLHFPTEPNRKTYKELVSSVVHTDGDPMNDRINASLPSEDPYVKYLMHHTGKDYLTLLQEREYTGTILNIIRDLPGSFDAASEWLDKENYEKAAKRTKAIADKIRAGGNYWAYSTTLPGDFIGAFVGASPTALAHPTEDRFLTYREGLSIMGMPEDFQLLDHKRCTNHICQNVPSMTAEAMAKAVWQYCHGHYDTSFATYSVLDLKNNQVEVREQLEYTVDSFL